jgi:subtilisin family serine protease
MAPNAKLINVRVLGANGTGTSASAVLGLDWIYNNRAAYNIKVVNLSLGMPAIETWRNDPLCRAARKLVDAGVVVVAAAGNNGRNAAGQKLYGAIHSPGNDPSVLTVGASNTFGTDARNDDGVTTFSSRGPTRSYYTDPATNKRTYDHLIKPDLVAPGNKLISATGRDSQLLAQHPELAVYPTSSNNDEVTMMYLSGTSMAAPIVAGTAALLLQVNPKLTPNMVKMSSTASRSVDLTCSNKAPAN